MKVLFDGQIFPTQAHGGISRYFIQLAAGLATCGKCTVRILAPLHINAYLREEGYRFGPNLCLPPKRGVWRVANAATKALSPYFSRFISYNIVHETYHSVTPYIPNASLVVTTVHDMIHEIYGMNSALTLARSASVARSSHVICVSESTRLDLCEILSVDPSRTTTVYHGYSDFSAYPSSDLRIAFGGAPYFLFVGRRSGYKNFGGFLRAFASEARLLRDFRILCFGGGAFTTDEMFHFRELGVSEDRIRQISGPDQLLAHAYRQAMALVYPSHYEGFGFPPLEAMSVGCPVICSNASSLPEVVGDAAIKFDPSKLEMVADGLAQVADSEQLRRDLANRGHVQRAKFSWERCCRETLAVYQKLM